MGSPEKQDSRLSIRDLIFVLLVHEPYFVSGQHPANSPASKILGIINTAPGDRSHILRSEVTGDGSPECLFSLFSHLGGKIAAGRSDKAQRTEVIFSGVCL